MASPSVIAAIRSPLSESVKLGGMKGREGGGRETTWVCSVWRPGVDGEEEEGLFPGIVSVTSGRDSRGFIECVEI